MTNAEFIRSMPDDKLAKFLVGLQEEQARQVYVMMGHYVEDGNFCPVCGAPMTDEAVQMVMERMEALYGKAD